MGPRLGRVEYQQGIIEKQLAIIRFNGATLRTRGIRLWKCRTCSAGSSFNGATLRTRGIHSATG